MACFIENLRLSSPYSLNSFFVVACTARSVNKLTMYIAFAAKSEEAEATL